MAKKGGRVRSDMAWATPDRIVVRGKDLPGEILGRFNLGDMAFLELTGRAPDAAESKLFNAMVVTLVEHGLTPSALAARLTYLGAPEALQGAVASGLLGLGSVFVGSTEGCAKLLAEALADPKADDFEAIARRVVADYAARKAIIPGLGHPLHKPIDPRTPRLFEIARETGRYGRYCRLIEAIGAARQLPVNATGAIGALACELGFDWKVCRGLGVMARAIGLVGHLLEESRQPLAGALWQWAEDAAAAERKTRG